MRDLFENVDDDVTSPVTRLVDQTVVETVEGVHRRISHDAREHGLEIVVNSYAPGTSSNDKPSHHEGVEYGVVIEGSLVVELGDLRFELHAGDAIHYESTIPHRIANVGGDVARAVWVNFRHA
jgi:quercetin dioxygenase-like cupin family protein